MKKIQKSKDAKI